MDKYIDKNIILTKELFELNESDKECFNDYFVKNNYLKYLNYFENISEKQEKALEIIFLDNQELIERCHKALEINNTCFEAYFILNFLSDSLNFYYDSLDIQNTPIDNYEDQLEINDVINIKMLISFYYSSNGNYHQALKFIDEVEQYIGIKPIITRKILAYNFLEDDQSIKKIYEKGYFNDPVHYIVYIICLLKKDKKEEARFIFDDMNNRYKYVDYLCKPQDLIEINDEESKIMINAVETCFDIIESVPFFFSWVSECIESKNAPAN